jgi:hypothetical protein
MKLTIIAEGVHSIDWPEISISVNNQVVGTGVVNEYSELDFEFELNQVENQVCIHYINKKEHHTVQHNNVIISDQSLTLTGIRVNDILLNNWIITEGYYYPDYFEGFKEQVPDAPKKLHSQLIWHFPGKFALPVLPHKNNFWHWYRNQRRHVHAETHKGKDDYRDEAYIGSLNNHQDLINQIKKLINV